MLVTVTICKLAREVVLGIVSLSPKGFRRMCKEIESGRLNKKYLGIFRHIFAECELEINEGQEHTRERYSETRANTLPHTNIHVQVCVY